MQQEEAAVAGLEWTANPPRVVVSALNPGSIQLCNNVAKALRFTCASDACIEVTPRFGVLPANGDITLHVTAIGPAPRRSQLVIHVDGVHKVVKVVVSDKRVAPLTAGPAISVDHAGRTNHGFPLLDSNGAWGRSGGGGVVFVVLWLFFGFLCVTLG